MDGSFSKGYRNGKLVVESFSHKLNKNGRTRHYYNCICDCGNNKIVERYNLTDKGTRSCGCLKREVTTKRSTKVENVGLLPGFSRLYRDYKAQAKKRKLVFNLSKEEFKDITSKNCYYCDKPKENISKSRYKSKNTSGYYVYNGIDRVNPSIGYIIDNVVSCCKNCNIAKMSLTQDEFFNMIRKIYEFRLR